MKRVIAVLVAVFILGISTSAFAARRRAVGRSSTTTVEGQVVILTKGVGVLVRADGDINGDNTTVVTTEVVFTITVPSNGTINNVYLDCDMDGRADEFLSATIPVSKTDGVWDAFVVLVPVHNGPEAQTDEPATDVDAISGVAPRHFAVAIFRNEANGAYYSFGSLGQIDYQTTACIVK